MKRATPLGAGRLLYGGMAGVAPARPGRRVQYERRLGGSHPRPIGRARRAATYDERH